MVERGRRRLGWERALCYLGLVLFGGVILRVWWFFLVAGVALWCLTPAWADDPPKAKIEGFGGYKLGELVSEMDLEDFAGPTRDASFGVVGYDYLGAATFHGEVGDARITIGLVTFDGRLHGILIKFTDLLTELKDLDRVTRFVRSLRGDLLNNYDLELVKDDTFQYLSDSGAPWKGAVRLVDGEGSNLLLVWQAYDLQLVYCTKRCKELMDEASGKQKAEDRKKL